jgi:adenylate cyclase
MGDGIMALFGLSESNPETICLNAVSAALNMIDKLDSLNQYAGKDCEQKFKMGIGIHFGEMIIGDVGHPDKIQFTAIGDTVNMASRIESATKDAQASILISEKAYCHIKDKIKTGKIIETELKGKEGLHKLHEVKGIL